MGKKVFITGATGFIGSHLLRRLLASEQVDRVAICKRNGSDCSRIADLVAQVEVYDLDLREADKVRDAIGGFGPDIVYHLATYYAVEHNPSQIQDMFSANVLGTINLLEAAKAVCTPFFVNTSTCFVYAQVEYALDEGCRLEPLNLYALNKIQSELACQYYASNYGLSIVNLRLFPPYGPQNHARRLIPYLIRSMLAGDEIEMTSGKQKWDYTFVHDIVDAFELLIAKQDFEKKYEDFNIGAGRAISLRDLVVILQKLMGSQSEPKWGAKEHRENEVWHVEADNSKAKELLGWTPKTSLEDGLATTIASLSRSGGK